MFTNHRISKPFKSRKAAEKAAVDLGYKKVRNHLMKDSFFARIDHMPASNTWKIIEGVGAWV